MVDEVLTIKEVEALLKLAEKTVHAMAPAGEIPVFKIRGQWRIKRTELDRWIDAQGARRRPHCRDGHRQLNVMGSVA
jgi:excisionase family DNA binding protein